MAVMTRSQYIAGDSSGGVSCTIAQDRGSPYVPCEVLRATYRAISDACYGAARATRGAEVLGVIEGAGS